jgi:hypothetical protein
MVVKQGGLARLRKQRSQLDRAIRALEEFEKLVSSAPRGQYPGGREPSQKKSPTRIGSRSPSRKAVVVYLQERPSRQS